MRYTFQGGAGEYGSFRFILATARDALDAAEGLMERGVPRVRILNETGAAVPVDALGRATLGHAFLPSQLDLIASTSDLLRVDGTRAAELFYGRLFEIAP